MDVIYRRGESSAREVLDQVENPPSYSAVRASLRILEGKGFLSHEDQEGRYVFRPTLKPDEARVSALRRVVETFFDNSVAQAMSTLFSSAEMDVPEEELVRLEGLIAEARKKGGTVK